VDPELRDAGADGLFLRVERNGQIEQHPVTVSAKPIRVAVGEAGKRSGIWRIWANKNDIYVAARTIAGQQKFSLHESGRWRYAWTEPGAAEFGIVEDRAIDRWDRPEPDHIGWTKSLSIWVRSEDVTDVTGDTSNGGVVWVPAPPSGRVAGIHIAVVTANLGEATLHGTDIVGVLGMPNGEAALILASYRDLDQHEQDLITAARQKALASVITNDQILRLNEPGTRLAIFGSDPGGLRWVFDTAAGAR
jgi:hypothetical protein